VLLTVAFDADRHDAATLTPMPTQIPRRLRDEILTAVVGHGFLVR
jgi:hypothetical protein